MAAETINAPAGRERKSFAQRLRGLWRRVEPGFTFDTDNSIERWDCAGEGPATCIAFEGFGITFSFFIGRTPSFKPYKDNERAQKLTRWYAGEKL